MTGMTLTNPDLADRSTINAVLAVCSFAARHCDEETFFTLDHFDVVNHELIVKGDGHN